MRNYNVQYKKYYDDIRNNSRARYNFNDYGTRVDGEMVVGNHKEKKGAFSDLISIFMYQSVTVIFLLMVIFFMKYSDNSKYISIYSDIKGAITGEIKTEEVFGDINIEKINKIFDDVSN